MAALLLATIACSDSNKETGRTNGEPREIRFGASVNEVPAVSRVVYDNSSKIDPIYFKRSDNEPTNPPITLKPDGANFTEIFLAQRIDENTPILFYKSQYYHETKNSYFFGYAPDLYTGIGGLEWEVNGKNDVIVSDKIYDLGSDANPIAVVMRFKHVLVQIEVVCVAQANQWEGVKERWGQIEYIKYENAATTVIIHEDSDYLWPVEGNYRENRPLLQADYETDFVPLDIPAPDNKSVTAAGMFAQARTLRLILLVKTTKREERVVPLFLPDDAMLCSGQRLRVKLTFNEGDIKVHTAINEWAVGETISGGVN